jgi:uncharacterized protein YjbI with pentapeptide repeats
LTGAVLAAKEIIGADGKPTGKVAAANLTRAALIDVRLDGANLSAAVLTGADLKGADISGAVWGDSNLDVAMVDKSVSAG